MISYASSKDIKDYREIIDQLTPELGYPMLHTLLQWCELATDPESDSGKLWQIWIVRSKGETMGICGLYSLEKKNTNLWLGWFGILPKFRRLKLGTLVLRKMEDEARNLGASVLFAYVDKAGSPLPFYEKNGYRVICSVRQYLHRLAPAGVNAEDFEDMNDIVICKNIVL